MSTRVVHCQRESYDVYVGRPSKWGSPFTHVRSALARFRVDSRDAAVKSYARWIRDQPELIAALHELKGKTLGCWCDEGQACHARDVLAPLADALSMPAEQPDDHE